MPQRRTVIPLPDYERIFRLICGVLDTRLNTPHQCIFFSLVGAAVLETKYKLTANPVTGAAVYAVSAETGTVSMFGRIENGELVSSRDAFHCWIECEGVIVDFMAPLFEQSLKTYGHMASVPPRMFQKPHSEMAPSISDLYKEGDFYVKPDSELALDVFKGFSTNLGVIDLANIVLHWYRRPPKPLPSRMGMGDDLGNVHPLELKGPRITGVW
jgi:hypothetical protein